MSKVVTIPKDRNPFVVIVNGVKHSYPAGVTIEVPDEVADVIEKYVGAKPKPDPNAGSGVSWNDLKDKPFGESPTGGDTLTTPAYSEEELLTKLEKGELVFVENTGSVKVSDAIVTMADLSNGFTFTSDFYGGALDIPAEAITSVANGVITVNDSFLFVFVDKSAAGVEIDGVVFPEAGTYIMGEYLIAKASITIPGYTGFPGVKKIEEKYLPGAVILYADAENYLYATADTSDTSKRMTRAELAEIIQSGNIIYYRVEFMGQLILMSSAVYLPQETFYVVMVGNQDFPFELYTAEYVPEG